MAENRKLLDQLPKSLGGGGISPELDSKAEALGDDGFFRTSPL